MSNPAEKIPRWARYLERLSGGVRAFTSMPLELCNSVAEPHRYYDVNVTGTCRLAEAMVA
jgi:hypothetical protein